MTEETQYIELVEKILDTSKPRVTRNNAITLATFGEKLTFTLTGGILPLLTTKRVFFRGVVEELLWFLRGSTDARELQDKGVRIWDGHSSRDHLNERGLHHYRVGDIGPLYGFQWRHSGEEYMGCDRRDEYRGIDQIRGVIESLRNDPFGRRHVVSAWDPSDLSKMSLCPCHCLFQFFVEDDGKLSCVLYQRSGDVGLGVPFNIASYSLLTIIIAAAIVREPSRFVHMLGDVHIYEDHVGPLREQIKLEPRTFPKVRIDNLPSVEMALDEVMMTIENLKYDDFVLDGYNPHKTIKMQLVV